MISSLNTKRHTLFGGGNAYFGQSRIVDFPLEIRGITYDLGYRYMVESFGIGIDNQGFTVEGLYQYPLSTKSQLRFGLGYSIFGGAATCANCNILIH